MEGKDIIAGIKEQGYYSFIANHYWELSKSELSFLAKELAFAVSNLDEDIFNEAVSDMLVELEDTLD